MRENTILFLDDSMISEKAGLARVPMAAAKHPDNPVVSGTYSWEEGRVYIFGSVIREPATGLFRMWYQAADRHASQARDHLTICYAESDDGVSWRKPLLDIARYRKRKPSNIVMGNALYPGNPYCVSVVRDTDSRPDERFKMTVWYEQWIDGRSEYNGAGAFRSADGLHWRPFEGAQPYVEIGIRVDDDQVERLEGPNDVNCVSPDKLDGQFVSWQVVRRSVREGKQTFERDLLAGDRLERVLAMQTSDDFVHWSDPQIIIAPTSEDPEYVQLYGMGGFRYGQYWLGTLWIYYVHDQSMDLELAVSQDGRNWTRPFAGHRLVSLGRDGAFDCGMLQSATAPVIVGDRIYIYYGGNDHRHDETGSAAIGLATLELDRWAGLKSGRRGYLVTQPFTVTGAGLSLNAYAHGGTVTVEILDEGGQALPGFEAARAVPVIGDRLAHKLEWSDEGDFSALLRQRIRARMEVENATIYALSQL